MSFSRIHRALMSVLKKKAVAGKVLLLLGARRVGKTELIKDYLLDWDEKDYLFLIGEDRQVVDVDETAGKEQLDALKATKETIRHRVLY